MANLSRYESPFYDLKQQGAKTQPKIIPLIVISWIPKGKNEPVLTNVELRDLFFGTSNSVANWFREASQGRYRLVPHPTHPVLGPFQSKYDWQFYWRNSPDYVKQRLTAQQWANNPYKVPPPKGSAHYKLVNNEEFYLDDEHYIDGHMNARAEAIRSAAEVIDFRALDRNADGYLSPDDALIVVVKAQGDTRGFSRTVVGSEIPRTDLYIDQVKVDVVCELYCGKPVAADDLAVGIEEVLHLAANLADQYPDFNPQKPGDHYWRHYDDPGRPEQLSLTDAGGRPVHVDPYHRLKWGWTNATVANQSGIYTLRSAATTGDVLIVPSPIQANNTEFFLVENRWRGSSYDHYRVDMEGEGLAIWHCIEDPALNQDWGRRAVFVRRADPRPDANGHIQLAKTLFDGNYLDRSYVLNDDSSPQNLRFRNNIHSGIEISQISPASAQMTLRVTLNSHIQVQDYQAAWDHNRHQGTLVLLFKGGDAKQLDRLDYGNYRSMLDSLRNEKPIWYDPNQNLLATDHEPTGKFESAP